MKEDFYVTWTINNSYWFIFPTFTFYKSRYSIRVAFMWLKLEIGFDHDFKEISL